MSDVRQVQASATSAALRKRPYSLYHSYHDPKYGKRVHCLYFYYIKPQQDGDPLVKAYYYDNVDKMSKSEMLGAVTALAQSAISPDYPPPSGYKFNGFKWRRRSYIAILIDDTDWQFDSQAVTSANNISLYNCKHNEKIELKDENDQIRKVPLFYCKNHMKKSLDNDYDLEKNDGDQYVQFTLNGTSIRFNTARAPISADGTNLGPPVPPPASESFIKLFFEHIFRSLQKLFGL